MKNQSSTKYQIGKRDTAYLLKAFYFIKHKPFISEECMYLYLYSNQWSKIFGGIRHSHICLINFTTWQNLALMRVCPRVKTCLEFEEVVGRQDRSVNRPGHIKKYLYSIGVCSRIIHYYWVGGHSSKSSSTTLVPPSPFCMKNCTLSPLNLDPGSRINV